MRDEGFIRYGVRPAPPATPLGWHHVPATPWTPAESHPPERCHPKCPQWPYYLGVSL